MHGRDKSLGSSFEPDETAVNAWLSVHMLASIMKTMPGAINRTTVLVKIPTTSNTSTYGFSTLVASNKKFTGLAGHFPQLMNRVECRAKVENGKSVLISQMSYQEGPTRRPVRSGAGRHRGRSSAGDPFARPTS